MSQVQTQEVLSETEGGTGDNNEKLVPVAESIRYRKRAQNAEKQVESLSEQLSEAQAAAKDVSAKLAAVESESTLMRKLAAAGAVDVEAAVLIAQARVKKDPEADVDEVVDQLRKEKQYLFGAAGSTASHRTGGVKDRAAGAQTTLERSASKAAATGDRRDVHEYLRLRRSAG